MHCTFITRVLWSFGLLAASACESSEVSPTADAVPDDGQERIQVVASRGDTIVFVHDQNVPSTALFRVASAPQADHLRVALRGDFSFENGETSARAPIDQDGWVHVPAFAATSTAAEGRLVISDPRADASLAIDVIATANDRFISARTAVPAPARVEQGENYLVLDEAALAAETSGILSQRHCDTIGDATTAYGPCICVFSGNVGKVTIAASCKGKLALWLIPENGAPAFTPPQADVNYEADGFKIGGQIYKIDGSTCNTIHCTATGGWWVDSCINNLAALLGKKAPYPVGPGTFSNEPPAGVAAKVVP